MRKIAVLLMLLAGFYSSPGFHFEAETISRDSLRTKWVNGKKFLMHKVQKGETFYSLSRDYKVDVKDLMNANKGVTTLKTGQIVQVPVPVTESTASPNTAQATDNSGALQHQVATDAAVNKSSKTAVSQTAADTYHVVKRGETLSGIASKYKVTVSELMEWNKLKSKQVNVNQRLLVARGNAQLQESATGNENFQTTSTTGKGNSPSVKYHQVKKGETLYGIAKKYGVKSNEILEWNNLQSSGLKTGQQLIVSENTQQVVASTEVVRTKVADEKTSDAPKEAVVENRVSEVKQAANEGQSIEQPAFENTSNSEVIDKTASGKVVKQSIETGEAAWVNDADLNPNKYFALHRTAPIGTIMKVTNRMNGKYVFVKVIGKLPGTGDNEKLIIKISKAAADKLGVIDPTFQCELNYAFASEN